MAKLRQSYKGGETVATRTAGFLLHTLIGTEIIVDKLPRDRIR